jgi:hypothetical protein
MVSVQRGLAVKNWKGQAAAPATALVGGAFEKGQLERAQYRHFARPGGVLLMSQRIELFCRVARIHDWGVCGLPDDQFGTQ